MITVNVPSPSTIVPDAVNATAASAVRHPYVAAAVGTAVVGLAAVKYAEHAAPIFKQAFAGWGIMGRAAKAKVHEWTSDQPAPMPSGAVRVAAE